MDYNHDMASELIKQNIAKLLTELPDGVEVVAAVKTKTPEETEKELIKILPKIYWDDFNHLFVKFGQTICVPTSPFCSKCPINKYCKKVSVTKNR